MSKSLLIILILLSGIFAQPGFAGPPDATGTDAIRSAVARGNPILIAKVLDSRLIAKGKRSQQLDYKIQVLRVLCGKRNPWLDSVSHFDTHYSPEALHTRKWNRGWTYLFVFDDPGTTMPQYTEPLSRFGKRKTQIIEYIESLKAKTPNKSVEKTANSASCFTVSPVKLSACSHLPPPGRCSPWR